jgi:hypothetical protein
MQNFDLVDWTMQEARQLSSEYQLLRAPDSTPSMNKLLEILEAEGVEANAGDWVQIATPPSLQPTSCGPTVSLSSDDVSAAPNTVADLSAPAVLPVSIMATPSHSLSIPDEARKCPLLKAIVAPDINTDPTDRDRAIVLRWLLRDIKNNRLKWWPINQHDLQSLTGIGLVKLQDDTPVLTDAGAKAII